MARRFNSSIEYSKSSARAAVLDENINTKIIKVAEKVYNNFGGRDYPRLDIRMRGEEIFVLEINNNPGIDFSDDSGFGVSGKAAGFTYQSILKHIVENCWYRFRKEMHDTATA
jgi:D-alanine-D-alanine ligase-like ATP-grasp enzyme